jgi:tetratricopeptide (TPR) repeat protein
MDVTELQLDNNNHFLRQNFKNKYVQNINQTFSTCDSEMTTNYIKQGKDFEQKGFYSEAIVCYKQIEKLNYQITSLTLIANCYYLSGKYDLAESYYLESLLHTIHEPTILFDIYKNLGKLYLKNSNLENAEKFYLKAYAIDPQSDDLLVNLATLDLQKSNEALALEKYRNALLLNEKNDKAWSGLSLVYELFGERELALGCIKKAIDINPENLNALHIYSQLCVKNKTPQDALILLDKWTDKHDFNINICLFQIELYIQNKEFTKARFILNLGFLWEPTNLILATWNETLKSHGI